MSVSSGSCRGMIFKTVRLCLRRNGEIESCLSEDKNFSHQPSAITEFAITM